MKLSKRCEYGIRASIRLAQSYGQGYLQSKEVASSESLPAKFLESILLALRSGGVLESKVGAGGGYRLTRSPSEIQMSEILRALLGSDFDEPSEMETPPDAGVGQHGLDIMDERMNNAIEQAVGVMSLADVLELAEERSGVAAPSMYYI